MELWFYIRSCNSLLILCFRNLITRRVKEVGHEGYGGRKGETERKKEEEGEKGVGERKQKNASLRNVTVFSMDSK